VCARARSLKVFILSLYLSFTLSPSFSFSHGVCNGLSVGLPLSPFLSLLLCLSRSRYLALSQDLSLCVSFSFPEAFTSRPGFSSFFLSCYLAFSFFSSRFVPFSKTYSHITHFVCVSLSFLLAISFIFSVSLSLALSSFLTFILSLSRFLCPFKCFMHQKNRIVRR